jgi:hypothetical protein
VIITIKVIVDLQLGFMTHDGKLEATYNIPSVGHNINSTFTSNVKSITYNNNYHDV